MSIGVMVSGIFQGLTTLIMIWCVLSWFPNIKWYEQPFKVLDQVVQPIIKPFRRLLPAMSGIDLSPMIAVFVLQFIGHVAQTFLP